MEIGQEGDSIIVQETNQEGEEKWEDGSFTRRDTSVDGKPLVEPLKCSKQMYLFYHKEWALAILVGVPFLSS